MKDLTNVNVWFDKAGDYLDVTWASGNTYYAPTQDDRVMALLDMDGNLCGFQISGISKIDDGEKGFVEVDLHPVKPESTIA